MLVLSRQRDETIMIGDDIQITIVDIRGDKVRLGITAPAKVPVHRKEVYDAIQRENREAARVRLEDLGELPKTSVRRPAVPPGMQRPSRAPAPPTVRPPASSGTSAPGEGGAAPHSDAPKTLPANGNSTGNSTGIVPA